MLNSDLWNHTAQIIFSFENNLPSQVWKDFKTGETGCPFSIFLQFTIPERLWLRIVWQAISAYSFTGLHCLLSAYFFFWDIWEVTKTMNLFNQVRVKQHLSFDTWSTIKRNTVDKFNVLFETEATVGDDEQWENANQTPCFYNSGYFKWARSKTTVTTAQRKKLK